MAGFIERTALMERFAEVVAPSNNSDFQKAPTWNDAVEIVENFPPADVRPAGPKEVICDRCGKLFKSYFLTICPECDEDLTKEVLIARGDVRPVPESGMGEMSDGYHTFNGLYYQRMMLCAALVKAHKDKAWKSRKHEDGELCFGGGWFIVGINTPDGDYTYHYEDKDFGMFDCKELPVAPHWDGHTEEDITRLLSLPDVRPVMRGRWIHFDLDSDRYVEVKCSVCRKHFTVDAVRWCGIGVVEGDLRYCPNCGADMRGGDAK